MLHLLSVITVFITSNKYLNHFQYPLMIGIMGDPHNATIFHDLFVLIYIVSAVYSFNKVHVHITGCIAHSLHLVMLTWTSLKESSRLSSAIRQLATLAVQHSDCTPTVTAFQVLFLMQTCWSRAACLC